MATDRDRMAYMERHPTLNSGRHAGLAFVRVGGRKVFWGNSVRECLDKAIEAEGRPRAGATAGMIRGVVSDHE